MGKPKKILLSWQEDENKERGNWNGKADFLLSTIGYAVGLGNVWRFPYKAYANGGASFLIPYVIFLVTCGLPLFFMELALGQFASVGPISIWKSVPLMKGIGWAMTMISFLVCIYYNMIIAYTVYYLCASFTKVLPWQHCKEEWMRLNISGRLITCIERNDNFSAVRETVNDWCNSTTTDQDTDEYLYNCTAEKQTPALLYWERTVLDISSSMDSDQYAIKWQLALCLLGAWIIVFFCMCKGVKSSGKVVYFTAIFPYIVLFILCIRNAMLEGSMEGILFYLKPDPSKLTNSKTWYEASVQIFYSLGVGFGGLATMSSYNRFHNNCYRDALLVTIINCGTSIFAGFVIFSVIGHMAKLTGEDVSNVVASGPGLAFVVYPEGIATMPVAPLWSVLFFLMLITLGLDSQFTMLETVVTALADEFSLNKIHRHGKTILTAVLCVLLFLIGLPQCTRAGVYVMNLYDWYSAGYSLIIVALCEVVAISWLYGFRRFKDDIQMMLGKGWWINASFYYYWIPTWIIISPVMMVYILITMCMNFGPITYGNAASYPGYADAVGFIMVALSLIFIPLMALIEYGKIHKFCNKIRALMRPTSDWGPALEQHRALSTRYIQNIPEQMEILPTSGNVQDVEKL
ncbi:hypothetical protein LSH36_95g07040 [Paralvinella palmiformis]|uniref:Transporter n=1 Tax=Paralvinella palmiformis TaxID=53620 RepID=A0AAD9K0I1_9ANNE|nr:hypothetical protein LSH36_95g07040 [Paralvinella palmiformis]